MTEIDSTAAGKPPELQGLLNRTLYHPLAHRLARALVPTPVTPNMVSIAGAVIVMAIAWALQRRMTTPATDAKFHLPGTRDLDPRLIGGSALFGIGWGLAGLCPGPAIASLATSLVPAAIFVAAMLAGMLLFRLTVQR